MADAVQCPKCHLSDQVNALRVEPAPSEPSVSSLLLRPSRSELTPATGSNHVSVRAAAVGCAAAFVLAMVFRRYDIGVLVAGAGLVFGYLGRSRQVLVGTGLQGLGPWVTSLYCFRCATYFSPATGHVSEDRDAFFDWCLRMTPAELFAAIAAHEAEREE